MVDGTGTYRICRTLLASLGSLAAGLLLVAAAVEAVPHGPILIRGPDDICELDQGITNCATADGSATSPYIISGWEIATPTGCAPLCPPLPACPDNGLPSLVAICDVDAHFIVRDVRLDATGASGALWQPSDGSTADAWPGALSVRGKGTIRLEDSELTSIGRALHVVGIGVSDIELVRVTAGGVGAVASSTLSPLVDIQGAFVSVRDSRFEASGRSVGLRVEGTGSGGFGGMAFMATNVTVTGEVANAMEFRFADVSITGATIESTSVPAAEASRRSGQVQAAVWTRQGTLHLADTTIRTEGVAVQTEGTMGTVEFNTFVANQTQAVALDAKRSGDFPACGIRFNRNDVNALSVVNEDPGCTLDATRNWWAGEPRVSGEVDTGPELPFRAATLPRLAEAAPFLEEHVGETARLSVTVLGVADEVRFAFDGTAASRPASAGAWSVDLDLRNMEYGPIAVELTGCREGFCGPTLVVDFLHVERPLSPIAVLRASSLSAAPGETVLLSGADSFSPQGIAIVAYRFGDGDWKPQPTLEWTMPREGGQATFTLTVRDAGGLESLNVARLTVHEKAGLLGHDQDRPVPGLPFLALVALLAGTLAVTRRP